MPLLADWSEPDADPGLDRAVRAVRDLLLAGHRFRQTVAERFGMDVTASFALSHLSSSGALTARELADKVGVSPSAMTALLDRLEAAGFAARKRKPGDRRVAVATVTERGEAVLVQTRRWLAAAFAGLDAEALGQTTEQLLRIGEALDAQVGVIGGAT